MKRITRKLHPLSFFDDDLQGECRRVFVFYRRSIFHSPTLLYTYKISLTKGEHKYRYEKHIHNHKLFIKIANFKLS